MTTDKQADLAGPDIGTYEEIEQVLPDDYASVLDPKETQQALLAAKRYIEDGTAVKGQQCEQCQSENLVFQEGCLTCQDCGSSRCG